MQVSTMTEVAAGGVLGILAKEALAVLGKFLDNRHGALAEKVGELEALRPELEECKTDRAELRVELAEVRVEVRFLMERAGVVQVPPALPIVGDPTASPANP